MTAYALWQRHYRTDAAQTHCIAVHFSECGSLQNTHHLCDAKKVLKILDESRFRRSAVVTSLGICSDY